jgi:ABC-type phosphate/phosphonate transport system permease subunit
MEIIVTLLLIIVLMLIYKWLKRDEEELKASGIVFKSAWPIVGNFLSMLLQREGLVPLVERFYNLFPNEK